MVNLYVTEEARTNNEVRVVYSINEVQKIGQIHANK